MTRRLTFLRFPLSCWLLVGLATWLAITAGCSEDISIRTYRVAKQDSRTTSTTLAGTSSAAAQDQLMLAAIVPNKDFAWFFKLTGEPAAVTENNDPFRGIVQSVEFDSSGQPSWKLSEGWKQQITPNDITYGKLTHGDSGLIATVTRLPFTSEPTEESWRGYVVSNINRWRNQLALQQQDWSEMSGELEELPELSQGISKAYFVSLSGKGSASSGMGPFMSRGGATPAAPAPAQNHTESSSAAAAQPPAATTAAEQEKPISYQVPEGWSETPASGMRIAAFTITEAEASGEVTVIAAGGEIEANIGIWLGQVGVEATEEHKQSTLTAAQALTVNGIEAKLYTIEGAAPAKVEETTPTSKATAESILICDIPWRSGQSLFVKFKGPSALATTHREKFVDFVKSIKWPK